jgi:BirA family transcriptional regulator, biotin operon repressor / biotin---[acetyl-CoA-carboxylase] ligase
MVFDLASVRAQLPGRRIEWHPRLDSTMTETRRLAGEGAPSGTVVGAEEQSAGVGRLGRSWHSELGSGLYISIILRRQFSPDALPLITLALGLATREAALAATGLDCDLRWPNDVLIQSRKCAGILTVLESSAIIAGIGINVNHSSFPDELSGIATSLRLAGGRAYSRERLLIELLRSVDAYCDLLETQGREAVIAAFARVSSYVSGRRVTVEQDPPLEGVTAGLNDSGFLMLDADDGKRWVVLAGGVRPCS